MKKIFSISLLALPSSLFAQATKIKIDVDRTIAWIDLKIYGMDELQTLPGYNCTKIF
jgi:hypothetical protein